MRPYHLAEDMDVRTAAEIDAALETALSTPLNELLSLADFAEKSEAVTAMTDDPGEECISEEEESLDTLPMLLEFEPRDHRRAA